MCSHADQKVHVAYNFNCLIENEGLLKVMGSHVHCNSRNILQTARDRHFVAVATANMLCY